MTPIAFSLRRGLFGADLNAAGEPDKETWHAKINFSGVIREFHGTRDEVFIAVAKLREAVERGEHADEVIPF